jgi:hypothetical protein
LHDTPRRAPPPPRQVSVDVVTALYQLLGCHGDPALRQLAFMALQRVAGQPATLYR